MKSALLTFLALGAGLAPAADLSAIGSWTETVTAADLTGGAGSDLRPFESVSGTVSLTITNATGTWQLRARRSGTQWDGHLALWVKRSSSGNGSGDISGGDAYIELTGTDTEIFSGSDNRSGVSLQFKLTGLTTGVSPSTYLSSITFTVR